MIVLFLMSAIPMNIFFYSLLTTTLTLCGRLETDYNTIHTSLVEPLPYQRCLMMVRAIEREDGTPAAEAQVDLFSFFFYPTYFQSF